MHLRAHLTVRLLAMVALLAAVAGCTAEGAGTTNFELKPERVGWYAGDEARFDLELTSSLTRSAPSFTIDRRFAIEEIQIVERGVKFGGDYETREPDEVGLRLERDGASSNEWTLDADHPVLDVVLTLPSDLRDSEYQLELKLFKVGWVKSEPFRVDVRETTTTAADAP